MVLAGKMRNGYRFFPGIASLPTIGGKIHCLLVQSESDESALTLLVSWLVRSEQAEIDGGSTFLQGLPTNELFLDVTCMLGYRIGITLALFSFAFKLRFSWFRTSLIEASLETLSRNSFISRRRARTLSRSMRRSVFFESV